jgi:NAD(P)-dependent dehydrogenase (short-subunit alcohol dehydrogenase family)
MSPPRFEVALIVGAGEGLSASLARIFAREGMRVALAARNVGKLVPICAETSARAYECDAGAADEVSYLFERVEAEIGIPDVVIYNAGARVRGALSELATHDVERALKIGALGGFLVAQQAVRRMLPRKNGAIFFTGASASIKGYAQSAPFAMGKFALRGLAQSMARELAPLGLHIAHFVIDGAIGKAGSDDDTKLDPDAIAENYLFVLGQERSAWTWEVELRPWTEKF